MLGVSTIWRFHCIPIITGICSDTGFSAGGGGGEKIRLEEIGGRAALWRLPFLDCLGAREMEIVSLSASHQECLGLL